KAAQAGHVKTDSGFHEVVVAQAQALGSGGEDDLDHVDPIDLLPDVPFERVVKDMPLQKAAPSSAVSSALSEPREPSAAERDAPGNRGALFASWRARLAALRSPLPVPVVDDSDPVVDDDEEYVDPVLPEEDMFDPNEGGAAVWPKLLGGAGGETGGGGGQQSNPSAGSAASSAGAVRH